MCAFRGPLDEPLLFDCVPEDLLTEDFWVRHLLPRVQLVPRPYALDEHRVVVVRFLRRALSRCPRISSSLAAVIDRFRIATVVTSAFSNAIIGIAAAVTAFPVATSFSTFDAASAATSAAADVVRLTCNSERWRVSRGKCRPQKKHACVVVHAPAASASAPAT